MGIGSKIQEISKKRSLSLKEVAERANMPYTTLHSIVRRNSEDVSYKTLKNICAVLDVKIDELIEVDSCYPYKNNNLRKIREEMGMTIEDFAKELDLSPDYYMKKELGELPTLRQEFEKIEELNGAPVDNPYNVIVFEAQEKKADLLHHFNKLNDDGQDKAVESVELLTKVPDYKK